MSKLELASTSNAIAVYSQPEELRSKIVEWVKKPNTYNETAQSSFAQSINRYAIDTIDDVISFINSSKKKMLRAIETKYNLDEAALTLKPSLIAKSLGCGSLGGLAAAQIATQMTVAMAITSCATPAGWIGGTGIAVVYYHFDKQVQTQRIKEKALLDIEKTDRIAEKMLSSLLQRRLNLQLNRSNTENSRLNRINADLDAQAKDIQTALAKANEHIARSNNEIDLVRTDNSRLRRTLNTANENINLLTTNVTNSNVRLAAAQTRIISLDNNVVALQQENQNLRTDLASNQTSLTTTAARIDELQTQNALNLVSVQQMNRDLIAEMRSEFQDREISNALKQEDRERNAAAKQIVERGIEKALRQEQENKISRLTSDLIRKSAAFEVLQLEHDHMSNQIKHRFDTMTQAMSRNPTESSVSELLRSTDQQNVSVLDSENNGDFIEVAQEM